MLGTLLFPVGSNSKEATSMLREHKISVAKTIAIAMAVAATLVVSAQGQGDGKGKGDVKGKGDAKGKGAPAALQALAVSTIKPGLFLITGDGGNTSVRVTKDGLIVTDTKNLGDPSYAQLAAKIKEISPAPVKYV